VLDTIAYFIEPASAVICNHSPSIENTDATYHRLDVHKECQARYMLEWRQMKEKGVIAQCILKFIIRTFNDGSDAYCETIIKLMDKFGLIVPMVETNEESYDDDDNSNIPSEGKNAFATGSTPLAASYICPALLPMWSGNDATAEWTTRPFSTIYLFFTTFENIKSMYQTLTGDELRDLGFLPFGLFERLVGKAIGWSQLTSSI
jgi:hypothetical protein